jgi:oxaloacetate decarboxylase gamma subunit
MDIEFSTALSLLAIGMITVFVVLALVVLTGNLLIRIVNRISPEQDGIAPAKIAAITAAVGAFTQGRGRITKIEKH